MRTTRLCIALYALLNAVLYSGLLPLWEGFDEPFHYGYVQHLSTRHRLPVLGQTTISREIAGSLELAPVSHVVRGSNTHWLTYDQYFALPAQDRVSRRRSLESLPARSRLEDSNIPNYEAHQPPLAYLVLALPDALLARLPVTERLFYLRVICAVSAAFLTIAGVNVLAPLLQLSGVSIAIVLFLTFSSQMFWATTAHVANDWLAVALVIWLLASTVQFHSAPTRITAIRLAIVLSLGLLTKAYFLAFLPVVLAVVLWRRIGLASFLLLSGIPAAWYIRNLVLYGTLSGTVESVAGIGVREAASAIATVPRRDEYLYVPGTCACRSTLPIDETHRRAV